MSHSFTNLLYHIVFSTKERHPWLASEVAPRVFAYLGGIVREQGGIALIVNGIADHVHLLTKLHQDHPVSGFVRAVKAGTSLWIHKTFPTMESFAWQTGYGAFTVSSSRVESVRAYIQNQEEHHRNKPFQEEFRELLQKHGIEFKEEELWD
jgi:putative transposase